MDFFGIGAGELILILLLVLIIWGPNKIPEIARNMGKTMRTIRKAGTELTSTLTREVDAEDNNKAETASEKAPAPSRPLPGTVGKKEPADTPETGTRKPRSAATPPPATPEQPNDTEGKQP